MTTTKQPRPNRSIGPVLFAWTLCGLGLLIFHYQTEVDPLFLIEAIGYLSAGILLTRGGSRLLAHRLLLVRAGAGLTGVLSMVRLGGWNANLLLWTGIEAGILCWSMLIFPFGRQLLQAVRPTLQVDPTRLVYAYSFEDEEDEPRRERIQSFTRWVMFLSVLVGLLHLAWFSGLLALGEWMSQLMPSTGGLFASILPEWALPVLLDAAFFVSAMKTRSGSDAARAILLVLSAERALDWGEDLLSFLHIGLLPVFATLFWGRGVLVLLPRGRALTQGTSEGGEDSASIETAAALPLPTAD